MSGVWAIRMDLRDVATAAALRAYAGVEACQTDKALWLRGPRDGGALERTMWLLPGERFQVTEKAQLVPWNYLLPVAEAPRGPWVPLAANTVPTLAAPALPGVLGGGVPLRLVRVTQEQPAALLLVDLPAWTGYMDTAATIRLARLRFALSAEGRVLVGGHPVPPLRGERFTLAAGIAVPCGWGWVPAVQADFAVDRRISLRRHIQGICVNRANNLMLISRRNKAVVLAAGTPRLVPAGRYAGDARHYVSFKAPAAPRGRRWNCGSPTGPTAAGRGWTRAESCTCAARPRRFPNSPSCCPMRRPR